MTQTHQSIVIMYKTLLVFMKELSTLLGIHMTSLGQIYVNKKGGPMHPLLQSLGNDPVTEKKRFSSTRST